MNVSYFQIQLQTISKDDCMDILHTIDPNTPILQDLEGGNMKGPLYLCVLATEHVAHFIRNPAIVCLTEPRQIVIDETLYRSHMFVEWHTDSPPSLVTELYKN